MFIFKEKRETIGVEEAQHRQAGRGVGERERERQRQKEPERKRATPTWRLFKSLVWKQPPSGFLWPVILLHLALV